MKDTDVAYIAGLFDGEGSIDFKRRYENRKGRRGKRYLTNAMNITMRIEMTHESILRWIKEKLEVGTVRKRNRSPSVKSHWKDRWTYTLRCRQAYYVCCLIWPYAHVKMAKIQKIIDHYSEKDKIIMNDKIINMQEYKERMSME
jgi:intein/homing endonuclease|tara:strand:+ start:71 stop:502 length:432 start_codon:yes stop_codon:yes gene_type:complete